MTKAKTTQGPQAVFAEALQCIDLTKAKIPVRVEAPGVRGLELDDLVPYRKDMSDTMKPGLLMWMHLVSFSG